MSNTQISNAPIASNAYRLLWAGFAAILATGVGFGVRGAILSLWGKEFGFTGGELGQIGGAGFTGFCFGIIIGGVIVDKIGYGKLVIAAFLLHVASAFVTFAATGGQAHNVAYLLLFWGTFTFACANGTLEAVANPLVATLFPNNRTHYLNILHAAWPAGLVLGGMVGWIMGGMLALSWKMQLAVFLVPTAIYGLMFMGQTFPKSEASQSGLSLGEMFKEVGLLGAAVACFLIALFLQAEPLAISPGISYAVAGALLIAVGVITKFSIGAWLMFVLFVTHALVGAVELGTDQWAQNITGNLLTPTQGNILFVFTSALMFALRFSADFIERKIGLSPVGLLCVCAVIACVGLNLVSGINTFVGALGALSVYALGKTFFWPTMLAVVGDRFPRTGAVAMSIMGGIGMMSAGLIGSPGLGYAKDRFASEELERSNPAAYAEYKSATTSKFLVFKDVHGLDGTKLANAKAAVAAGTADDMQKAVQAADMQGDRRTLKADAFIPAIMAAIFLVLVLYFKAIGGYRALHLNGAAKERAPSTTPVS